ncbi:hypothetical protein [Acidipropionibacterium jensenii]|uniref:hypothetical protein n=1 Tax=Acidipropionibacterium jensenii TaxID=1749 RepID=UPI000FDBFE4C|nr:hypothetical protein [Acidipropionibacterium jensenii]
MMKSLIVIVDSSCGPCSSLGRELSGIPGIRAIAATSEEAASLGAESQAPCVIEVAGSGDRRVYRGWAMRMRLARHLGLKRAGRWFSLLGAELGARQARATAQTDPSRRTILAGGMLAGLAVIFGAHSATEAEAAPQQSARALSGTEFTAPLDMLPEHSVIKSSDVHDVYQVGSGEAQSIAFIASSGVSVIIPEKHPEAALAMASREKSLWFGAVDGMPIVELTPESGKVITRVPAQSVTTPPAAFQARSKSNVAPQGIGSLAACVTACSGRVVTYKCLLAYCIPPGAACSVCGGAAVVACVIECL